jgi:hypothetical protein
MREKGYQLEELESDKRGIRGLSNVSLRVRRDREKREGLESERIGGIGLSN